MPGSTPTAVPSSTPISANSRFIGCSATVRPWHSAEIGSIGGVLRTAARAVPSAGTATGAWRTSGRRRVPSTKPIARSVRMARRPNAVAVAANRIVIAGMKPPPIADQHDHGGEAAEDQHDRQMRRRLALRKAAAERHDEIADGEQAKADRRPRSASPSARRRRSAVICSVVMSQTMTPASTASSAATTMPAGSTRRSCDCICCSPRLRRRRSCPIEGVGVERRTPSPCLQGEGAPSALRLAHHDARTLRLHQPERFQHAADAHDLFLEEGRERVGRAGRRRPSPSA